MMTGTTSAVAVECSVVAVPALAVEAEASVVSEAALLVEAVPEAAGKPVHSLIRKLVIRASLKSEALFVFPMVKIAYPRDYCT